MKRAGELQCGQWFHMRVLTTFPGAGHQESRVHNFLRQRHFRVHDVPGREWLTINLHDAVLAIVGCLRKAEQTPALHVPVEPSLRK
eukprot:3636486-Karenia_brevis.AAC.1